MNQYYLTGFKKKKTIKYWDLWKAPIFWRFFEESSNVFITSFQRLIKNAENLDSWITLHALSLALIKMGWQIFLWHFTVKIFNSVMDCLFKHYLWFLSEIQYISNGMLIQSFQKAIFLLTESQYFITSTVFN